MDKYKVLIIGGGPAGLSGALTLGRMHISTLLVDSSEPRNLKSKHLNNFPTRDGINPSEWRRLAEIDLAKYPSIKKVKSKVSDIKKIGDEFKVILSEGKTLFASKILFATGVKDILPSITGLESLWGEKVFHCPFCHGFEVSGKRIGLIGDVEKAKHLLPMLSGLSSQLFYFSNGETINDESFLEVLNRKNIFYSTEVINEIQDHGELKVFSESFIKELDCFFVTPKFPLTQASDLASKLGCKKNEFGFLVTDEFGKTTVDSIYSAGDNMSGKHSVLMASASGSFAASMLVKEILSESFWQK